MVNELDHFIVVVHKAVTIFCHLDEGFAALWVEVAQLGYPLKKKIYVAT